MSPETQGQPPPYRLGWVRHAWSFLRTERQIAHLLGGAHLAYLGALWKETEPVVAGGRCWPSGTNGPLAPVMDGTVIDNLYRPANEPRFGFEQQQFVLGDVHGVRPQFREVAIQEWWHLVAPSGYLLLRVSGRRGAVPSVERSAQLCPYSAVRFRKPLYYGRGELVLLQKQASVALGRMDQWTFGLISNGKRLDWLREAIASIHAQGIPDYEILVIGPRQQLPVEEARVRVIDFSEQDELGWISRKKNLLVREARHENLAILHDRIALDAGWHAGMQRYGNAFWLLGVPTRSVTNQQRNVDWVRYPGRRRVHERLTEIEFLDYEDWDPDAFLNGALLISKRTCWTSLGMDERLFWQQNEDLWFARAFVARGWLPRLNPFSLAWSKTFYRTRIALKLRPGGSRRRVVTPWKQFFEAAQP